MQKIRISGPNIVPLWEVQAYRFIYFVQWLNYLCKDYHKMHICHWECRPTCTISIHLLSSGHFLHLGLGLTLGDRLFSEAILFKWLINYFSLFSLSVYWNLLIMLNDLWMCIERFVFKFVFNCFKLLKLCICVKHYLKLFKIVLIVIGVHINIYCSSILTFTKQTALGEITLQPGFYRH